MTKNALGYGRDAKPRPSFDCECGDHVFALTNSWGVILVSPEDRRWVEDHAWWVNSSSGNFYAVSSKDKKKFLLHRAITSAPKGMDVDHLSGFGLDNRRGKLRVATRQQNNFNRFAPSRSVSGFHGVTPHKASGLWRAQINIDGKLKSLGYYKNPEDAARGRDAWVVANLKHKAPLNFGGRHDPDT